MPLTITKRRRATRTDKISVEKFKSLSEFRVNVITKRLNNICNTRHRPIELHLRGFTNEMRNRRVPYNRTAVGNYRENQTQNTNGKRR